MAEYIDSGTGKADQTLGYWLGSNVLSGIQEFRCQFGYFRFAAIKPFADILRDLAASGRPVHIVLGSNSGSLVAADAQRALQIISGANATLTIVAYSNAEFHPKTAQLIREDNSFAAVVGSANLTSHGLGQNVEAGVVFDSRLGDQEEQLNRIRDSIDNWRKLAQPVDDNVADKSVFSITSNDDLRKLVAQGIINVHQPRAGRIQDSERSENGINSLHQRPQLWQQQREGWSPEIPDLIPLPSSLNQGKQDRANKPDTSKAANKSTEDVLLMRVRPRRNGRQLQISMSIHSGKFMSGAKEVVDTARQKRKIGFNKARGKKNTARFEAPEMANMNNPVALFRWVNVNRAWGDVQKLQVEIFDAADSAKGTEIFNRLEQGIPPNPVTDAKKLSHNLTVVSKSELESAQWYRMHKI